MFGVNYSFTVSVVITHCSHFMFTIIFHASCMQSVFIMYVVFEILIFLCASVLVLLTSSVCRGVFTAEISLVICDREEKAAALLENKEKGVTPTLSCLVLFNDFSDAFVERAKNCEVEVLKLEELMVSRRGGGLLKPFNADSFKCVPFNLVINCDM